MSRGGFLEITLKLVEERQLFQIDCADWSRSRSSAQYLATALFIELLLGGTFAYFAFGDRDAGKSCYGQTVTSYLTEVQDYKRVTSFTVDGMQNIDIGELFNGWFLSGLGLTIAAATIQILAALLLALDRNYFWFKTLYMVLDSALILLTVGWLSFGAYWRFREFGVLCSESYLIE